jgi:hypothetical protein
MTREQEQKSHDGTDKIDQGPEYDKDSRDRTLEAHNQDKTGGIR